MIQIKEEFVGCKKWHRAIELGGAEAIQMWLAIKRYAAEHLTDGFVADSDIETIPGAPRKARKALKALVECGKTERDGTRGHGLVDAVSNGWELHDYLDHANSADEEELRREKAREKKRKQREAKRRELEALRSSPSVPGTDGDMSRGQMGTTEGTVPGTSRRCPPSRPLASAPARPHTDTRTGPPVNPTQPNPTQPPDGGGSPKTPAADSDGPIPLRNLAAALQTPVVERAQRLQAEPHTAQWCEPHRWPELIAVNQAWADAFRPGKPTPRLQRFEIDPVVKTLIEAFAAGYDQPELERIAASFGRGDFVREAEAEGKRPSLAWLKGDALRNEAERVASVKPLSATVQRALAAARAVT